MIYRNTRERSEIIAEYVIDTKSTVRGAAQHFGISKSTVHKDISIILRYFNPILYSSVKEILDISQRLKAAKMLKDGENYVIIAKETGMSTATISRVSKCLEYGNGGYKTVIERTEENKQRD